MFYLRHLRLHKVTVLSQTVVVFLQVALAANAPAAQDVAEAQQ